MAGAGVLAWALVGLRLPSPSEVTSSRVVMLEAADGEHLTGKGSFRLPPIAVRDMPSDLINAIISIEDKRFYQRGSIDPKSILRAFVKNEEAGQIVAGGSTITQQLVKILFLDQERTYKRKIREAAIATWLEFHLTKDEILTSYLNNVYLGSRAIGFPAAAQLYFGKNVKDLSLPEAAMLAGMIKAPVQYNPITNLNAARKRAAIVLDAMVANGKLTQEAALVAKLRPATPNLVQTSSSSAGWFADWVDEKAAEFSSSFKGTIRVRTTLDLHLQERAQSIINATLAEYGSQSSATEAALIAMRPDGAVVAMVGGRSYSESPFNRAVQAKRQPGSAFKLFDYYAALRKGFSVDDEVLDEPIDVRGWEPQNYSQRYHGRVTLADAFANSLNAATVRLSQEVGIDQVIAAARDLGLRAPLGNYPSLALGTSPVSLLDLTAAYAAVRAGIAPIEPWGIASLRTSDSRHDTAVGRPDGKQHSIQDQSALIELLQDVVQYGTGRAAALQGFAAGKTGTSQDYHDAWFIGFNDSLIVGVWVGNDDGSPMKNVVGGTLPAMIWKQFMEEGATTTASRESPPTALSEEPPSSDTSSAERNDEEHASTTQRNAPPRGEEHASAPKQNAPTFEEQRETSTAQQESSAPAEDAPGANTQCDVAICEQYYQSFRASDCTYQPYDGGPRQYCAR